MKTTGSDCSRIFWLRLSGTSFRGWGGAYDTSFGGCWSGAGDDQIRITGILPREKAELVHVV